MENCMVVWKYNYRNMIRMAIKGLEWMYSGRKFHIGESYISHFYPFIGLNLILGYVFLKLRNSGFFGKED